MFKVIAVFWKLKTFFFYLYFHCQIFRYIFDIFFYSSVLADMFLDGQIIYHVILETEVVCQFQISAMDNYDRHQPPAHWCVLSPPPPKNVLHEPLERRGEKWEKVVTVFCVYVIINIQDPPCRGMSLSDPLLHTPPPAIHRQSQAALWLSFPHPLSPVKTSCFSQWCHQELYVCVCEGKIVRDEWLSVSHRGTNTVCCSWHTGALIHTLFFPLFKLSLPLWM